MKIKSTQFTNNLLLEKSLPKLQTKTFFLLGCAMEYWLFDFINNNFISSCLMIDLDARKTRTGWLLYQYGPVLLAFVSSDTGALLLTGHLSQQHYIVFVSAQEKVFIRTKRNDTKWNVFVRTKKSAWSQNKEYVGEGQLLEHSIHYITCEILPCSLVLNKLLNTKPCY